MSSQTGSGFSPPPRRDAGGFHFTTGAGAHGFQQFGHVHGDTHLHVSPEATPEELYRQGRSYLDQERAEEAYRHVSQAVSRGYVNSEVLYYLMLTIVRRRALDELAEDELRQLREAGRRLRAWPDDEYRAAGGAVLTLLLGAFGLAPEQPEETEAGTRSSVHADLVLKDLPEARREEIRNHLRSVISGAEQDRLDQREDQEVREGRMSDEREERVPLFFIPDPVRPKPLRAAPPRVGVGAVVWLGLSALACAGGLVSLVGPAFGGTVEFALPGLLLVVAGAAAALRFGLDVVWRRERQREEEERRTRSVPATRRAGAGRLHAGDGGPSAKARRFHDEIYAIVRRRFDEQIQRDEDVVAWRQVTDIARQNLAAELTDLYAHHDQEVSPWSLDWLVQYHARTVAEAWRTGTLRDEEAALRVPVTGWLGYAVGVAALAAGAGLSLFAAATQDPASTAGSVLLLGVGGFVGVRRLYRVLAERSRFAADSQTFARRHEEELRVYAWWRDHLAERRPTDGEMARWLDYDLRHLRRRAVLDYQLRNSDIETSFFVLEAAPGCLRARVRNGPPRYSDYVVRLFVLTSGGFRLGVCTLDFVTGGDDGRSDHAFRYDVIGSVVIDRESGPLGGWGGPGLDVVRNEALRITLGNQQQVEIQVENYEQLYDPALEHLDLGELRVLALKSSGITRAFNILIGVAAEGRSWFDQQRARNRERFRDVIAGPDEAEERD